MDDRRLKNQFLSFPLATCRINLQKPKYMTIDHQNYSYSFPIWCHNDPNVIHGLNQPLFNFASSGPGPPGLAGPGPPGPDLDLPRVELFPLVMTGYTMSVVSC